MSLPTVAAARPYCVSQIAAVRPLVRGRGGAISGLKYSTCGRGNSHVSVLLHKSIDRHVVRWYRTSGATVPTSSTFLSSSASISSIGGALATETSRVWSGARWPAWRWCVFLKVFECSVCGVFFELTDKQILHFAAALENFVSTAHCSLR